MYSCAQQTAVLQGAWPFAEGGVHLLRRPVKETSTPPPNNVSPQKSTPSTRNETWPSMCPSVSQTTPEASPSWNREPSRLAL